MTINEENEIIIENNIETVIKFQGINGEIYNAIRVKCDDQNTLNLEVLQFRFDSDSTILRLLARETYKSDDSINDVELECSVGTNSFNDKLKITFNTKLDNDDPYEVTKLYDRETIFTPFLRSKSSKKSKKGSRRRLDEFR